MKQDGSGREAWADIAKAIGIVLVVYGHVARGAYSAGLLRNQHLFKVVDSVIYSFHMPLFFLLSGLFFLSSLEKRGALSFSAMKVDTIVYPYVIWSLLQGGIEAALSKYTNGGAKFDDVLTLLWAPRAQFWFLYALFLLNILSMLVYRRASLAWMLICSAVFAGAYLLQPKVHVNYIAAYIFHNGVFFSLGILIGAKRLPLFMSKGWAVVVCGTSFVAAEYLLHSVLGLDYSAGGPFALLTALAGIAFVLSLSMWSASLSLPLLSYIGGATMAIYLMHILATAGARILLHSFFKVDSPWVHLALGTFAGMALPLLVYRFLAKRNIRFLFEAPAWLSLSRLVKRREVSWVPPSAAPSNLEPPESTSQYA